MIWLKWRDFLKPRGQYNRTSFLFWFFIPIVFIVPLVVNIWEFEKFFIRLSFYVGRLGFGTHLLTQFLAIFLILFLVYLIVTALIKRCNDLNRSAWWTLLAPVPIIGMMFLVYLLFWPGKPSHFEPKKRSWLRITAMSVAAIVVFALFVTSSLFFEILSLFKVLDALKNEPVLLLRVWNQTDELLDVEFTVSDGIVYQGYPVEKVKPDEIIKNEKILSRQGRYIVTGKNTAGEKVYSKSINSVELVKMNWIILIPHP